MKISVIPVNDTTPTKLIDDDGLFSIADGGNVGLYIGDSSVTVATGVPSGQYVQPFRINSADEVWGICSAGYSGNVKVAKLR
jgi:hypothetical protein